MIYDLRYIIYNFIILFILLIVNNSSNAQGLQESDSLLIDQNINLKDSSIINDTIATTTNQSFSKYKKKFTAIDTVVKSDSTITTKKIKKQKKIDTTHYSPKVAAWRGAIFPGLGQIYMKKYWKLPIVYGAIGTVLYFLIDNGKKLTTYNGYIRNSYNNIPNPEPVTDLSISQLENYRDVYRRNTQITAFATFFIWGLSIVDAVVDAHLHSFDVSDKLAFKIKPKIINTYDNYYVGIALNLDIK